MVLQHSLPICLTFVLCTTMLGVLPIKFWTRYTTDKNLVWLRSITKWECASQSEQDVSLCFPKHTHKLSLQTIQSIILGSTSISYSSKQLTPKSYVSSQLTGFIYSEEYLIQSSSAILPISVHTVAHNNVHKHSSLYGVVTCVSGWAMPCS